MPDTITTVRVETPLADAPDMAARTEWAWAQDVKAREQLVLLAVAHREGTDTEELASFTGLTRETVSHAIVELERRGLLAVTDAGLVAATVVRAV